MCTMGWMPRSSSADFWSYFQKLEKIDAQHAAEPRPIYKRLLCARRGELLAHFNHTKSLLAQKGVDPRDADTALSCHEGWADAETVTPQDLHMSRGCKCNARTGCLGLPGCLEPAHAEEVRKVASAARAQTSRKVSEQMAEELARRPGASKRAAQLLASAATMAGIICRWARDGGVVGLQQTSEGTQRRAETGTP